MKKLVFGLIAMVMFSFVGNAQTSKIEVDKSDAKKWIEVTAKFHLMITFLETSEEFKNSKNSTDFHAFLTKGITDSTIANDFRPLSEYVYSIHKLHSQSKDFNITYNQLNPTVGIELIKKMSKYDRSQLDMLAKNTGGRFLNGIKKFAEMVVAIIEAIEDFIKEV
jgi:hypothetical protein